MVAPDDVRNLPPGSVVISSTWAAFRLLSEPGRYRFWQVTGRGARLSDTELVRLVAATQRDGDDFISIVRVGSEIQGATREDLAEIASEVASVIEDTVVRTTYGLAPAAARSVSKTLRDRFKLDHPRLARLINL